LRLQPFPTLTLELVEQHPALLAQQLEALVLIAQWLKAPFSELFGPARAPQCAYGGDEVDDAKGTKGEKWK
jgi:hypothetical protein